MAGVSERPASSAGTSHVIGVLSPHVLAAFSRLERTAAHSLARCARISADLEGFEEACSDSLQDTPPAGARAVRCRSAKARLQTLESLRTAWTDGAMRPTDRSIVKAKGVVPIRFFEVFGFAV